MPLKITLVTPPDIFQNDNPSILLMNLVEKEQDLATQWLGNLDVDLNLNIYFYQNEPNAIWFLHSLATSSHKYIDIDNTNGMSEMLLGYLLSKPATYYKTKDTNKNSVFCHINQNRVDSVTDFLERVFCERSK